MIRLFLSRTKHASRHVKFRTAFVCYRSAGINATKNELANH